jgi:serine/threonine protein kinase/tetratricopeptide (TPR) repeat protein
MADTASRNALQPGNMLHWYRIEKVLGQGGFGITYLATDTNLDHKVAIKEYLPLEFAVRDSTNSVHPASTSHDERYRWGLERFVSEARTLAKFKHRSIVQVLSVFEANNTAYMVMEYERGKSLQEVLDARKTLTEEELTRLVKPLLSGLELIHAQGFIHRDIKPANIFVRQKGPPVLLDFGSARQALGTRTRTLTTIVSPGYAPFEQYYTKSDRQGPWTDIYAMAATLYRSIAGRAPLDAVDRSEAILKAERDIFVSAVEVGRGRYSERFLEAIDAGLRFREKERPQTIAEWRDFFDFTATKPSPPAAASSQAEERTFALPIPPREEIESTPIRMDPTRRDSTPASRPTPRRGPRTARIAAGIVGVGVLAIGALEWRSEPRWVQWRGELVDTLSGRADRQAKLLAAARQARAEGRLLGPGSALTHYQAILAQTPDHAESRAGLTALARQVLEDTRAAIARADFPTAERQLAEIAGIADRSSEPAMVGTELETARRKRLEFDTLRAAMRADLDAERYDGAGEDYALPRLRSLLARYPDDPGLRADLDALPARLEPAIRAAVDSGDLARAQGPLAMLQELHPEHATTIALTAALTGARSAAAEATEKSAAVEQHLARAQTALAALRLTGPPRDNALEHYREVLKLEPASDSARAGIERIVTTYLRLATEARAEDDPEQATVYLERAARVLPSDPRIASALAALRKSAEAGAAAPQPPAEADERTPDERRRAFEEDLLRLGR